MNCNSIKVKVQHITTSCALILLQILEIEFCCLTVLGDQLKLTFYKESSAKVVVSIQCKKYEGEATATKIFRFEWPYFAAEWLQTKDIIVYVWIFFQKTFNSMDWAIKRLSLEHHAIIALQLLFKIAQIFKIFEFHLDSQNVGYKQSPFDPFPSFHFDIPVKLWNKKLLYPLISFLTRRYVFATYSLMCGKQIQKK